MRSREIRKHGSRDGGSGASTGKERSSSRSARRTGRRALGAMSSFRSTSALLRDDATLLDHRPLGNSRTAPRDSGFRDGCGCPGGPERRTRRGRLSNADERGRVRQLDVAKPSSAAGSDRRAYAGRALERDAGRARRPRRRSLRASSPTDALPRRVHCMAVHAPRSVLVAPSDRSTTAKVVFRIARNRASSWLGARGGT